MRPAVAIPDYIPGAVEAAPKAVLKRLHCLAAALALLLHATLLLLGFWLGGATTATPVRNPLRFISVRLDQWPSGAEAGRQETTPPGRKYALRAGSTAGQNRVSAPVRAAKKGSEKNPAQEISQENGEGAGEENPLAEPAAGGGSSSAQAGSGLGSGAGAGVGQGVPVEVLARPLYERNPPPLYPRLARRMGKQGVVLLEVFVSASGMVEEVKVATGSGYEILDEAALDAVRGWRFAPGQRNGQPAAMRVRVPVRFELRG
ncbi:MAG: energy transducer TonB [Desulfurivibrionaceae bacterium]